MKKYLLIVFYLCIFGNFSFAEERTRILFVGNSYTGQVRGTVTKLFAASPEGKTTELEFITPGGKTLAFHLANEATTKKIQEGNWDFVVLQDQSQTPAVFPRKFEAAAVKLDKLIDSSGAKTVFYQTWGRRDGDRANPKLFPTYESMQNKLSKNYLSAAKRCMARLAPVGDTWSLVRKENRKLGRELYRKDGSHPSAKGAYLAACVFYATIFETSPGKVGFTGGLSEDERRVILQSLKKAL